MAGGLHTDPALTDAPRPFDQFAQPSAFVPEPSWRWRRILTYATSVVTGALLLLIVLALVKEGATNWLGVIAIALIIHQAARETVYLVAPTTEYVSRIAELVRAAKG